MPDTAAAPEIGSAGTGRDALADLAPVSHAIFRTARLHKMLAGQLLRQAGLYPGQELVMMRLWVDGPQRQVDLVRMLESEAPTVTRTIRRLEKAGLVRTSRNPDDGRSTIVEATEASRSLRDNVEQTWMTLESRTVGGWTEEGRRAVLDALAALETNLVEAERGTTLTEIAHQRRREAIRRSERDASRSDARDPDVQAETRDRESTLDDGLP